MSYEPRNGSAPSDADAERAWDEIMVIARRSALLVSAYGGVATLAIPSEQRKAGIRERVLRSHLFELEAALRADGWEPDSAESPR